MRYLIILASGLPRAGKSSFADAVEKSSLSITHVPMDKYIMAVPPGRTFLEWVREPSCVDWELLMNHLQILFSGETCFTPKPDWTRGGRRVSEGGPIENGPGRRMLPSKNGYLIAGTHVFSLPELNCTRVTVYVDTPDEIIASRLEGRPVSHEKSERILRSYLDNTIPLRPFRERAQLVIDGTQPHEQQVNVLRAFIGALE